MNAQSFHVCIWLCGLLFLAGCSSESTPTVEQPATESVPVTGASSSGNPSPPQVAASTELPYIKSAEIFPSPITLDRPVQVVIDALDPKGGAVTFQHQWRVNGFDLGGATAPQLDPKLIKRGDKISVTVIPVGGQGPGLPFQTSEVLVQNTLPRVTSLTIEPFPIRLGDHLVPKVTVVDADEDEVTLHYRWTLNGNVVSEGDPEPFHLSEGHRGDEVQLVVTPSDVMGAGEPFLSKKIKVSNSLPRITSTPPSALHNSLYLYSVTAVDSDGDPLVFGLKDPPANMTIDPKTGKLQWAVTPEVTGQHTVTVTVSDGHHNEPVEQEFDITIGAGVPELDG